MTIPCAWCGKTLRERCPACFHEATTIAVLKLAVCPNTDCGVFIFAIGTEGKHAGASHGICDDCRAAHFPQPGDNQKQTASLELAKTA